MTLIREIERSAWAAYLDWADYLANPRIVRADNVVSWADRTSMRTPSHPGQDDIRGLATSGQYSFQAIEDGGLFQLYYECDHDGETVVSANLGFYRIGEPPDEDDDDDDLAEVLATESDSRDDPPIGWLRVDYAPTEARGVLHSECHLHLVGFLSGRWVVDGLMSPRQFVELMFQLAYPDAFAEHRLDAAGTYAEEERVRQWNQPVIALRAGQVEAMCTHLRTANA